ncbi:MAG: thioredoxin domain-containing protein [Marinilabiliales bacterium]|nr:thioredoxin domain-containing protein [Marinilabiliales bacterium]
MASVFLAACSTRNSTTHPSGEKEFIIRLKGKKLEHLILSAMLTTHNHMSMVKRFHGTTVDGSEWHFSIPDSIRQMELFYGLLSQPYDPASKTFHTVRFQTQEMTDAQIHSAVLDEKYPVLEATYFESKTIKTAEDDYFVVDDSTWVTGPTLLIDLFRLQYPGPGSEMELRCKNGSFADVDTTHYDRIRQKTDSLILKYPDSHFLMTLFSERVSQFRLSDASTLFSHFSKASQNSLMGQKADAYLRLMNKHFVNTTLLNGRTNSPEPVVRHPEKINLLVFSASWCSPCHALIPTLKKIHQNLGKQLEITYISMDEGKFTKAWQELMQKESIPWRDLVTGNRTHEIEQQYHAGTLPHMLLVHPDGTVEETDIRKPAEMERLYKLSEIGK